MSAEIRGTQHLALTINAAVTAAALAARSTEPHLRDRRSRSVLFIRSGKVDWDSCEIVHYN